MVSYPSNNYFYVNYTNNAGDTVVSRFRVTADPDIADPILLTIAHGPPPQWRPHGVRTQRWLLVH